MKCFCEKCNLFFEAPDDKYNAWARCSCGSQAKDIGFVSVNANDVYAGYNVGLGEHVRSKTHYKKLVREKGFIEHG